MHGWHANPCAEHHTVVPKNDCKTMTIPVRSGSHPDLIKRRCQGIRWVLLAAAERSTAKKRQAVVTDFKGLALPAHFFLLGSLIPLKVHFREVAALVRASSGLCLSGVSEADGSFKNFRKDYNYGISGS